MAHPSRRLPETERLRGLPEIGRSAAGVREAPPSKAGGMGRSGWSTPYAVLLGQVRPRGLKLPNAAGGNRSFALTGVTPSKAPCARTGVARSLIAIRYPVRKTWEGQMTLITRSPKLYRRRSCTTMTHLTWMHGPILRI